MAGYHSRPQNVQLTQMGASHHANSSSKLHDWETRGVIMCSIRRKTACRMSGEAAFRRGPQQLGRKSKPRAMQVRRTEKRVEPSDAILHAIQLIYRYGAYCTTPSCFAGPRSRCARSSTWLCFFFIHKYLKELSQGKRYLECYLRASFAQDGE